MDLRMILKSRLTERQLPAEKIDDAEALFMLLARLPCDGEDWHEGGCPSREHGVCRSVAKLDICAVLDLTMHLIKNGVCVTQMKEDED